MRKIIVYGLGRIAKSYIDIWAKEDIKGLKLVDSNSKLWGEKYDGFEIHSPSSIIWDEYDLIIISASKRKNIDEIYKRLADEFRVPKEKIVYIYEVALLSKNEIYNLGNMELKEKIDHTEIVTVSELYHKIKPESLNDFEKFFFENRHSHYWIGKWLHYFEAYDRFFSKYRGKNVKILEIGVFQGGSLQMWKNYFKGHNNQVQVYGIDIDPACKEFESEDIKIYIGSQDDREFLQNVKNEIGKVDIVIDDGSHMMAHQIVSFEELFEMIDDNGVYLCEDLHTSYMSAYGGGLERKNTFIEYCKKIVDELHIQYWEEDRDYLNPYYDRIKSISFYDSMVFVEKKNRTTKSITIIG